jgi:DNA-binding transcriptional LysR family regulator
LPTPALTQEQCDEALAAVAEHGSITAAAEALGFNRATFQNRVNEARRRKSGMIVTGRSTLTNLQTGEPVMEWVKESLDRQKAAEAQQAAYAVLAAQLPRSAPTAPPRASEGHLCTVYTLTDCHVGALAWHREGGADWDLQIAEDTLLGCFGHMIDTSPASELGVVNQLGDFLHFDGLSSVTPTSGHLLDADGRFEKVVAVAIRILRRVIDLALAKHSRVHVILAEGNHDLASSVWLRQMFAALYEKEPRITVEQSPLPYYALEWGKTLLAFHHGHLKKNDQLPLLFAAQFAPEWGRTTKRYCHTGHRHHLEEKEHSGMIVFQHPTLAARDAYAARGGWHAMRSATAVTYHRTFGEVGRATASPDMLS